MKLTIVMTNYLHAITQRVHLFAPVIADIPGMECSAKVRKFNFKLEVNYRKINCLNSMKFLS